MIDIPYCDYCEQDGHTYRSCPARDDDPHDSIFDRGEQGEEDFATGPDQPARWLNPPRPIGDHDARQ
jgi:hypothetical protein